MKRRQFGSLLGGSALAPFAALPAHADPSDALGQVADRLVASGANVHSILVARGDRLVFERYFSGPDEVSSRRVRNIVFDAGTLHDMKSVSKSVSSLALGIAIDCGLIASVEEPILSFFPELSDMRSAERERFRLVHALTMSMGQKWVEATPQTGDEDNDEARMNRARDPARYVLGLPVMAPPGQEFFYSTGALRLVSAIVHKATGRLLDDFARTNLLEPLGIADVEWERRKGDTDAGGGLRLRPRDMVKIGQLILNGGRWNGRQIVSKAWIDASMTPRFEATSGYFYGYLWWLGRSLHNGHELHWAAALGRGGQSIRIVPELDLVVAVTAGYYQDYSPQAFRVQSGIFKDVLRTISSPG
jgi:CubicO group peptidase (beta-lactamase class C family)